MVQFSIDCAFGAGGTAITVSVPVSQVLAVLRGEVHGTRGKEKE
jgi:hypothetical protein